ncbi:acetyltransferase [Streptomyces lincolnensis]|uniref:Acetyltransferase n=1 Tax=Streptomyces lincolnensis TaxID=1915 RepID=A0A1B1M658_STRLN|nr:GNAT family N-acetyltransferase [Streptomyces lincolnensis]ANS63957.1 acetyltransferase [Streptomyces lincolnensis]AXG57832.1 acetyltransferase [Streptomyces lincolnensis]QMV05804.1 GNAT family N-acetyltransferase [Streptomyces lincolnensis]
MTTTLRPIEPLQRAADGTRSRRFQVCVNSRPVGDIHLGTSPTFGAEVALITDLRIEEPDRRRGRGTVAALAAEEVARGWGCRRIEAAVPAEARTALGLATALGYVVRNRLMAKTVGAGAPALPAGSRSRPMTQAEFALWTVHAKEEYAQSWISRGVPESEARAKADKDHDQMLPDGPDTEGMLLSVLEHEGTPVGTLWLAARDGLGFVYDVETEEAHRGRGHGRSLMLAAEAQAVEAGWPAIRLNVFAGNGPAERLYASLGYETITHHVFKELL